MKAWAYVVIITLVIGALAGVFGGGFQAGKVSERVKYIEQIDKLKIKLDAERVEYEKATSSLALALLEQKIERVTVYETIENEVIKYITDNAQCDVNYGAYGLLYTASTDGDEGQYASLTDAEKRKPALTQPQAFRVCLSWAKEYHDTIDQLHLLQDRVNALPCTIDPNEN